MERQECPHLLPTKNQGFGPSQVHGRPWAPLDLPGESFLSGHSKRRQGEEQGEEKRGAEKRREERTGERRGGVERRRQKRRREERHLVITASQPSLPQHKSQPSRVFSPEELSDDAIPLMTPFQPAPCGTEGPSHAQSTHIIITHCSFMSLNFGGLVVVTYNHVACWQEGTGMAVSPCCPGVP